MQDSLWYSPRLPFSSFTRGSDARPSLIFGNRLFTIQSIIKYAFYKQNNRKLQINNVIFRIAVSHSGAFFIVKFLLLRIPCPTTDGWKNKSSLREGAPDGSCKNKKIREEQAPPLPQNRWNTRQAPSLEAKMRNLNKSLPLGQRSCDTVVNDITVWCQSRGATESADETGGRRGHLAWV